MFLMKFQYYHTTYMCIASFKLIDKTAIDYNTYHRTKAFDKNHHFTDYSKLKMKLHKLDMRSQCGKI